MMPDFIPNRVSPLCMGARIAARPDLGRSQP